MWSSPPYKAMSNIYSHYKSKRELYFFLPLSLFQLVAIILSGELRPNI